MLFKFPRVFLAAASATSILALSSCVLPTSLPTSSVSGQAEASQSSAPAVDNSQSANAKGLPNHTIGEVLEIGKYLPEQNGQEAFHPCRDLTKEQWDSLGLEVEPYDPQKDVLSIDSTLCQPKMKEQTKDNSKSVTIMADYRDIKEVLKNAKRQDNINVKKPDYVYFYTNSKVSKDSCTAATVTNQGRFAVQANEFMANEDPPMEPMCQRALDIMQKIIQFPAQNQHRPPRSQRHHRQHRLLRSPRRRQAIMPRRVRPLGKNWAWGSFGSPILPAKLLTRAPKSRGSSG